MLAMPSSTLNTDHGSFNSIVAEVVEGDMYSGLLQVVNVFYVADAGFAYCPNAFKAKMESGSVFGLTAALHEKLALKMEQ